MKRNEKNNNDDESWSSSAPVQKVIVTPSRDPAGDRRRWPCSPSAPPRAPGASSWLPWARACTTWPPPTRRARRRTGWCSRGGAGGSWRGGWWAGRRESATCTGLWTPPTLAVTSGIAVWEEGGVGVYVLVWFSIFLNACATGVQNNVRMAASRQRTWLRMTWIRTQVFAVLSSCPSQGIRCFTLINEHLLWFMNNNLLNWINCWRKNYAARVINTFVICHTSYPII